MNELFPDNDRSLVAMRQYLVATSLHSTSSIEHWNY